MTSTGSKSITVPTAIFLILANWLGIRTAMLLPHFLTFTGVAIGLL
jgi:hypothetical protein